MKTSEYRPPSKKKKNTYANNSRCNEWMRGVGWDFWNVQTYNSYTFKRLDLFNLFDKVALGATDGGFYIIGVQLTDYGHLREHITKMTQNPYLLMWKSAGGYAVILYSKKEDGKWRVLEHWF